MLCPANMLGYLLSIRLATRGELLHLSPRAGVSRRIARAESPHAGFI
jgi:hypothetical protein